MRILVENPLLAWKSYYKDLETVHVIEIVYCFALRHKDSEHFILSQAVAKV